MFAATARSTGAVLLAVMCTAPVAVAVTPGAGEAPTATPPTQQSKDQAAADVAREGFRQSELFAELAKIRLQHPDIGELLNLSAEREQQLLDLMARQSLEILDRSLQRLQSSGVTDSNVTYGESMPALITRQNTALKQLLGTAGFWRYQEYIRTRWQRVRIEALDALLPRPLTREQRQQLAAALTDYETELDYLAYRNAQSTRPQDLRSAEQTLAQQQALYQRLLANTAPLLDAQQQTVFANWQGEFLADQRAALEHLRQRLGVTHEIAAQHAAAAPDTGDVPFSWRLQLTVNHTAAPALTFKSTSGHGVTFKTPQGLQVEAIPLLAEDDAFSVRLNVFETDTSGRHFIGTLFGSGPWLQPSAPLPAAQTTILSGSRGYALSLSAAPIGRPPSRERGALPFARDE